MDLASVRDAEAQGSRVDCFAQPLNRHRRHTRIFEKTGRLVSCPCPLLAFLTRQIHLQLSHSALGGWVGLCCCWLFDEQRRTIIAECCEKVSHHELQAARAEQERKILQEELWRQQQDFRSVHQQDLIKMKELQKNSKVLLSIRSPDRSSSRIRTLLELSGRLQDLQNEVNCMNDSKDFQDAESVRSGNSHVTSQPMLFPKHPPFEGMLRPSFESPRRRDGPPDIWDTPAVSGNVFAKPHASSSAPYPQELNSHWKKTI